jgi:adenine-specific DNA methylase
MYKAFIKNLLAENKIVEVLKLMRNLTETQNKYFSNPLINLTSQFNRNKEEYDRGRNEQSDFNRTNNRIIDALESILDSEFEEETISKNLWTSLTSNLIEKECNKYYEYTC